MTLYEFLLFVHIMGAIAWLGASITMQLVGFVARRSNDPTRLVAYAEMQAWLGPRYFAPISMIVLLAGIGMVIISGYDWEDLWIAIGIALWAVTVATGMFYLAPESERIAAAMLEGPPDDAMQRRIDRIERISRVDLALLVLIVADMTIKPGA